MPLAAEDFILEYPTPSYPRAHARCRVRIWERPEHTVVIATELPEGNEPYQNPGASVTNTVEVIATELYRQGHIRQPDTLLLIEHYDHRDKPGPRSRMGRVEGESFDQVRFHREGDTFSNPDWRRARKAEVEDLIGEALP